MFEVRDCWHINHLVRDYRKVASWYGEVFGARTIFEDSWTDRDLRWATMVTIRDLAIDVLQPSAEGAQLPMGRALARLGEHFSLVAYTVDAPALEIYDRLAAAGIRAYTSGGGDRAAIAAQPLSPVFTLAEDSAGAIELMPSVRVLPEPARGYGFVDPRRQPGWSNDPWRDDHPLGIESWYPSVVVADLERAVAIYAKLGGRLLHREQRAGAWRAYVALGTAMVELLRPIAADTLAARDLERKGEIFHAVNFGVRDLCAAERYLRSWGLELVERERDEESLVIDPATAFGAVLRFSSRRTPWHA
jgi:catechol 2,3-dioxygenase-like lactoylglutathione lyase family enzyme